jgi:acyl carrier protein
MSDQLTQQVLSVIAATQRISPEKVTIDRSFQELGIDSMDGINILFALENEFDITIPDEQAKQIHSIQELGIDSMDGINILFALENEFDITIPDEQAKQIHSIQEMVDGIRKLVSESTAKAQGQ